MKYFSVFISTVLCLCLFTARAQKTGTAAISGTIKAANGEAITGVSVSLKETSKLVLTDVFGKFIFRNVQPGNYTLQVSSVGYKALEHPITLKQGEPQDISLTISNNRTEMQAVTITGKSKVQQARESAFTVNAIETKQYANTTADINQILNRSTGVRIREQGGLGSNFNFSINGLSGKSVKYFIDGVPMEILGSTMSLNNIPVNLAERIEVYKGVVPVQLGSDAMGGAVNVITSQKVSNYLDVSHSYGSFNTHRSALTGQYVHKPTGIAVKASAFYNYSDNNYKMKGVEIIEGGTTVGNEITNFDGAAFVWTDARRFHDNFRSVMGQLELGITNKKWADLLFASISATDGKQDLQSGFEQKIVFGNVTRTSNALSGALRYKKDNLFVRGLNLNIFASLSKETGITADTLFRQYYWDGAWTPKASTENGGIKTLINISRPRTFARANASYALNEQHSLNLNYTLDYLRNENFNELLVDHDDMPGQMNKRILGLAYQQELFDRKLTNILFVKQYSLELDKKKFSDGAYKQNDTTSINYGYGIATRYKLLPELGIKASFEHAYRLQEVEEVFGDGLNLQPNPDLKPESSDNFNLGAYYGINYGKHRFFIEAAGFYRNAKNFIYPVPDQRSQVLKNENKSSVRVTGFESEFRYNFADLLSFNINATYQNAVNTTKFGNTTSTTYEATYLNKIPNQPWFFGNADLSIGKNDILGKDTRLQFNWFSQYVHWFYLTWENFGDVRGKSKTPDQLIHNATISYSLQNGKYNISAECRNLTDKLAFDNYMSQKPGRSFSIKLRYFIK